MPKLSPEFRVIFSEEFRSQIRSRGFMFFTVVMIIVMLAAIPLTTVIVDLIEKDNESVATDTPDDSVDITGYVDLTGRFPAGDFEGAPVLYSSKDEGIEAVRRDEIDTLFVVPVDYVETGRIDEFWTMRRNISRMQSFWGGNWEATDRFREFLRSNLIGDRVDPKILSRALDPASFQTFDVPDEGAVGPTVPIAQNVGALILPMLFAALLMMAAITGSGALLRSIAEEKETRMIEMLVTTASPFSILTGKLLAVCATGLIHMSLWVVVGVFAMPRIIDRIPNGGELTLSGDLLITITASFILGYFLYSVLALFIGSVVSSAAEGQRQTGMLSMLAGMPIWVSGLILNVPDGIIAKALTWFPFSAPSMLMVRHAAGSSITMGETAVVLALVAVTGLVMLWVSARVFRAGILLSGQRITGRNVFAALRHAE